MNISQHIWLAVCWLVFSISHSVLAADNIKAAIETLMQKNFKFYRLSYSVIATVMITYILFLNFSITSVLFKKVSTDHLQVNGLNKYVRHPLYAATLLFAWSFFFWQPLLSNFTSCISILLYTLIGIFFEERKLIKAFGNDYKQYAAKVPMIIPGLL